MRRPEEYERGCIYCDHPECFAYGEHDPMETCPKCDPAYLQDTHPECQKAMNAYLEDEENNDA